MWSTIASIRLFAVAAAVLSRRRLIRCQDRVVVLTGEHVTLTETVTEIESWMVAVITVVVMIIVIVTHTHVDTVMIIVTIIVRGVHAQTNVARHGTFGRSRLVAHVAVQVAHDCMREFSCRVVSLNEYRTARNSEDGDNPTVCSTRTRTRTGVRDGIECGLD
jgi:hypothetical protein